MQHIMHNKRLAIARRFFLLIVTCYALASFHRTVLGSLGADIGEDFGVGGGLVSVMAASLFYPYAIMQVAAGIFSDRWGARRTVTLALLITCCGTGLLAMAWSVPMACFSRILTGIGIGLLFVPGIRLVQNWFPAKMHPLWTGLYLSLGCCGMFFASWPIRALTSCAGWRNALLIVAGITFILAILGGLFLRNSPADAGLEVDDEPASVQTIRQFPLGQSIAMVLKSRTYWGVSIWMFCLLGVFYAFIGLWAGSYFLQAYLLDSTQISLILAAISVGGIVGPSLYGVFLSFFPVSKRVIMLVAGLGGLAMVTLLIIPCRVIPFALLPVWGFLFTFFLGSTVNIGILELQENLPPEIAGTATGMVNIYCALGGAILQMASGLLMEILAPEGVYTIGTYSRMFILFWILLAVGCLGVLLCKKRITK